MLIQAVEQVKEKIGMRQTAQYFALFECYNIFGIVS